MKTHTQTFKENLITLGKEIDAKITYTIDGVETELDGDTLGSVTPHYEASILKSIMKQVDIVCDNEIPLNTEINVQFGMKYEDEEFEYINYGNYVVYSCDKQEDTNNYKIVAYDKMLYSMKEYEPLEITYPITIRDYLNAICNKIGVSFANANSTFANYDQTIESELYDDTYTYRDVLDEIAQTTASTICINDNDELEIRYINDAIASSEEVEGTNFTLTSENASLSGLELKGETSQDGIPTPSSPIPVNVVSGDNEINICGKNLFDKNSNIVNDYTFNSSGGTFSSSDFFYQSSYIAVKPNTTYCVSKPSGSSLRICEYKIDKTFIQRDFENYSFTTTANTYFIRISDKKAIKDLIQIEKGSTATTYEPYIGNTYPIYLGVENLCKLSVNGLITGSNGTITTTSYSSAVIDTTNDSSIYIEGDFTKLDSSLIRIGGFSTYPTLGLSGTRLNATSNGAINVSNYNYVLLTFVYSGSHTQEKDEEIENSFEITKGTSLQYITDTPIELCKIGTYQDYIYKENGSWYLHKEIGKVVLNGSESWVKSGNTSIDRYLIELHTGESPLTQSGAGLSTRWRYSYSAPTAGTFYLGLYRGNTRLFVSYATYGTTSVSDFKSWLNSNNTTCYYVLATPTNTQITSDNYPELYSQLNAIDKAKTYQGTTNITSTLPIKFTYVSEFERINEDYIKNTRAEFGEKYGPINSIVLSRSAESDNVYLRDEDSVLENGLTEIKIVDNQIMNDNTRDRFLPGILEKLDGLEYYINDFESIGITYLDLCDRYRVVIRDNEYPCVMFNDEVEIGDGLNEIIYTELPEETITDYTKADKTDRRINQIYFIVDKQKQRIDAVVSTQEEDHDTLSQLTIDVDGIRSRVELNYDFIRETSGNNYISVDDMQQEGLIELKITGTAINNEYLRLHITNNEPEYIDLPITNIIQMDEYDFDTLSIESVYNEQTELYELHCFVDKKLTIIDNSIRLNTSTRNFITAEDTSLLRTEDGQDIRIENFVEGKEDLGVINLPIQSGQHTISIDGFSDLNYYLKYAIINNISSEFALKKHIVSEINQSAEQIQISADKVSLEGKTIDLTSDTINIDSNNFKVDSEGNMTCNNATANNLNITSGSINLSNEAGEGSIILGEMFSNFTTTLGGEAVSGFGPNVQTSDGVIAPITYNLWTEQYSNYYSGSLMLYRTDIEGNIDPTITLNGRTGNIICNAVNPSKAERKKNFEKLENALDIVKDVDIYKYNYKIENDADKKHIGFVIGDNFNYREEITTNENDGAELYSMISVLWKAVQEQQKEIDILKGGK